MNQARVHRWPAVCSTHASAGLVGCMCLLACMLLLRPLSLLARPAVLRSFGMTTTPTLQAQEFPQVACFQLPHLVHAGVASVSLVVFVAMALLFTTVSAWIGRRMSEFNHVTWASHNSRSCVTACATAGHHICLTERVSMAQRWTILYCIVYPVGFKCEAQPPLM